MTTEPTTESPPPQTWPTLPGGRYAVLRCCHPDGTSSHGFRWPLEVGATVTAPDWDPDPGRDCGGGLHGLLWGAGDGGLLGPIDGVWMVVAVDPADIATPHTDGIPPKVRFRACEVVHVGDRVSATGWLVERAPGVPVAFSTATAGDEGTASAGDEGTASAGYRGTASAGYRGTASAGDEGTASAGDEGTATAGYEGTATAGDEGTASAGYRGTASAGDRGCISILRWDGKAYRRRIAEVDGKTIRAGVAYRLDDNGNFVEVQP